MDSYSTEHKAGLMGRESTDLGSCVAGLVNTLARETVDLVASRGLIPLDFALLRLFVGRERWTTKELAEVLLVKTSRVSRVVTKLVDMGLMRRRRPRNDRRVVFLTLTEDGKALTLDLYQACAGLRSQALRGCQRGGDGDFRLRHLHDHRQSLRIETGESAMIPQCPRTFPRRCPGHEWVKHTERMRTGRAGH